MRFDLPQRDRNQACNPKWQDQEDCLQQTRLFQIDSKLKKVLLSLFLKKSKILTFFLFPSLVARQHRQIDRTHPGEVRHRTHIGQSPLRRLQSKGFQVFVS